ncbi:TetR/AcrR family transcriptional regulator, partial [Escherichia coli]|nr:TetR/AcrR family transcriptional regulator [Escherichia coli]
MKLRLLSFLLSLRSNPVMIAITKRKWGSGMYLD